MLKLFIRTITATLLALGASLAWAQVEINTATATELAALKGIGHSTAERILEERGKAPFANWQDFVSRTPGIGEKKAQG